MTLSTALGGLFQQVLGGAGRLDITPSAAGMQAPRTPGGLQLQGYAALLPADRHRHRNQRGLDRRY
jgi:hypothetical protein